MNRKSRSIWLLAVFAVFAVVLAGCGSDKKSSSDKTTTTARPTRTTAAAAGLDKLTATIDGRGSSFQDTFEQKMSSDFGAAVQKAGGSAKVTYTKTGSTDGKKGLGDKTVDFAGSDSAIKPEEAAAFAGRKILYFPITGGPIAVAYNLTGVDQLNLSADTLAKIFQAHDHHLERPGDQGREPERHAAGHQDRRRAPFRRFRHHVQLHQVPQDGVPHRLDARLR